MTLTAEKRQELFEVAKGDLVRLRAEWKWNDKDRTPQWGGTSPTQPNALYGFVSTTGQVKKHHTYACHAYINQYEHAGVLWSGFGRRCSERAADNYLTWLTSTGPWAQSGVINPSLDRNFMATQGFVIGDLDKLPANVVHNFLVAQRMSMEWGNFIDAWDVLVTEHGVNPELAFVFLTCFDPIEEKYYSRGKNCWVQPKVQSTLATQDKYDWPLDTFRATEEYVRNFCAHRMVNPSPVAFWPSAVTAPVNTLWGPLVNLNNGVRQDPTETYLEILWRLYGADFTEPRRNYKPGLGLSNSRQYLSKMDHSVAFTQESILAVLKLEEKRLEL